MQRTLLGALIAFVVALGAAGTASAATAHGKITKVDAKAGTFVLKEGKQTQTFSLETGGKVMDGAKAITLDQLKTGSMVQVEYTDEGGKHVASKVTHKAAAKHAKSTTHSGTTSGTSSGTSSGMPKAGY